MRQPGLSPSERQLLWESVLKPRPDCRPVVERLDSGPLPASAREPLREAVVAELCATGLDENDEPNRRGRALEELVDVIGHR